MERNFDLKDALRGGITPEQMMDDFAKQLATAQREVAMEQAAANSTDLDEARADMVDAIIDYLIAMGLVDEDVVDTDEIADDLVAVLKEAEQELAATKPLLDMLRRMKAESENTERTPDDVIGEFLKSLRQALFFM